MSGIVCVYADQQVHTEREHSDESNDEQPHED